jgi:hypothetical protein
MTSAAAFAFDSLRSASMMCLPTPNGARSPDRSGRLQRPRAATLVTDSTAHRRLQNVSTTGGESAGLG